MIVIIEESFDCERTSGLIELAVSNICRACFRILGTIAERERCRRRNKFTACCIAFLRLASVFSEIQEFIFTDRERDIDRIDCADRYELRQSRRHIRPCRHIIDRKLS